MSDYQLKIFDLSKLMGITFIFRVPLYKKKFLSAGLVSSQKPSLCWKHNKSLPPIYDYDSTVFVPLIFFRSPFDHGIGNSCLFVEAFLWCEVGKCSHASALFISFQQYVMMMI